MDVYLFLGLHNSYFPPDTDFQVLVQVVSSKLVSDKSHWWGGQHRQKFARLARLQRIMPYFNHGQRGARSVPKINRAGSYSHNP